MFYKYESDFDNDLMFWSNATADLWHKGEIGESDLPDELLHALNELWTDSHLVCCYLVALSRCSGLIQIPLWCSCAMYIAGNAISWKAHTLPIRPVG